MFKTQNSDTISNQRLSNINIVYYIYQNNFLQISKVATIDIRKIDRISYWLTAEASYSTIGRHVVQQVGVKAPSRALVTFCDKALVTDTRTRRPRPLYIGIHTDSEYQKSMIPHSFPWDNRNIRLVGVSVTKI